MRERERERGREGGREGGRGRGGREGGCTYSTLNAQCTVTIEFNALIMMPMSAGI